MKSDKPLTRDEILAANDVVIERVETPEWGGSGYVNVRGMTAHERDLFDGSLLDGGMFSTTDMRAKLLSLTVCDETGKAEFGLEDVKLLGQKSASTTIRVFKVAQRLSGMTSGAADIIRNLKNARPASSPTA